MKKVLSICLKDPGSAVTHFIGMLGALGAGVPLIVVAAMRLDARGVAAMSVFAASAVLLYSASTIYHSLNISDKVNTILRKLDHMMIFVLIAGSYTPICVTALNDLRGYILLAVVWAAAAGGMVLKGLWITCPDWLSSTIYMGMGWISVSSIKGIFCSMSGAAFGWLVAGGVIYTIGGVLYALENRFRGFGVRNFGMHELFHLFVMGGSACHYVMMFLLTAPAI